MINKKLSIPILTSVLILTVAMGMISTSVQENIPKAEAIIPVDAMTEITFQIQQQLTSPTVSPEVQRENIKQAEGLIFGKPVIFVTNEVPETIEISHNYDIMTETLKQATLACVDGGCGDPRVQAEAKELADRITYWQETKATIEFHTTTATCDVNNPVTCVQLDRGDEPQVVGPGINVGTDKIWNGWHREIRSPYSITADYAPAFSPNENIIALDAMAPGECSTIVKEIQGVKSILRPVIIPIWQEPWESRAQIIGYQTIWVVDFVPAEFVKSLNYCNDAGTITFDYDINVIIERELLHFWKFLPAGTP